MHRKPWIAVAAFALVLGLSGCNREQSDWEKARAANNTNAYEQYLKKYPSGSFSAQAQARLQELNEDRDWQKARDTDTAEAYQAFLKLHPEGKWSEEARIRIENFALAQPPGAPPPAAGAPAGSAPPVAAAGAPAAAPSAAATSAEPAAAPAKPAASPARPESPSARRAPHRPAAGTAYGVQLGAFKSGKAAAMKHWRALAARDKSLLHGLKPQVRVARTSSGRLYRLQAQGLSAQRAQAICKRLKARRQPCIVLRPDQHRKRH